jgi:DNA-binding GntR family transcriptional regulator
MPKRQTAAGSKANHEQAKSELPLDVEIANRLVREIIALKHVPGAWLREQEIAERFNVSRSPVREALRHIAKQGFVQMHPWRGAQIVELSSETTAHVFDMLEALYGVVARHAAQSMPAEKLPELWRFLKRGEKVSKPGAPVQERVALSFEVGRYIGKWGTTAKTYEVFTHVGNLAMWQHRFMQTEDIFARRSMEIHCVMVSAIEARDGARAEWAARAIVDLSRDRILPNLPEQTEQ